MKKESVYKILLAIAISLFVVSAIFFYARKINPFNADIGRHIENGRAIVEGGAQERNAVLFTNKYSYTNPDFPFVNHHWGGSVILFLVYKFTGYTGLIVSKIIVLLASLSILFWIAKKESSTSSAILASVFLLPLIAYRIEVRPEHFTVLFGAIFVYLLWRWDRKEISNKILLILLPVLMLFWVNIHIGFIFGVAIVGLFFLSKPSKVLFYTCALVTLTTLVNPHGFWGAIYPFMIFSNYGYQVYENVSIAKLEGMGHTNNIFPYFKIAFLTSWIFVIVNAVNKKSFKAFWSPLVLVPAMFTALSFTAVRNISLAGYFLLPILAVGIYSMYAKSKERNILKIEMFFLVVAMLASSWSIWQSAKNLGFGANAWKGDGNASSFFIDNGVKGPVFNNYDIGGYLIHYISSKEKVFVDNRPEAYPAKFFTDEYIPMQMSKEKWQEAENKYGFQAVFWYHQDLTGWSRSFINMISQDRSWALVYRDSAVFIAVKRGGINENIIKNFELRPVQAK